MKHIYKYKVSNCFLRIYIKKKSKYFGIFFKDMKQTKLKKKVRKISTGLISENKNFH